MKKQRRFHLLVLLAVLLLLFSAPAGRISASAAPQADSYGLNLGSGTDYITFGDPSKLDLAHFTIETWFNRTGPGIAYTTGVGGLSQAIPLVTHGSPQSDGSNIDENWILAIDDSSDVIAADFEDMANGTNYPVVGTTHISINTWHHTAATYDGFTWHLYLDGNLEATLAANAAPRSDTIQQAGLGAMINSNGVAVGHFEGILDEVRVWNVARTQAQIDADLNNQLTTGQGLVARWSFEEGGGTAVGDSISPPADGNIMNTGYTWVAGAPFNLVITQAPYTPVLVSPVNGALGVPAPADLRVTATDPDGGVLTVTFYGRPAYTPAGPNFTVVALPDTQNYTILPGGTITFSAQTQWVVDNRLSQNIVFVSHLGDITENGDNNTSDSEWIIADHAMSLLERGTPDPSDDIPFGLVVGNHDVLGGTTHFENHFGVSRFTGRPYYGGHFGSNNVNSYSLFSADGMNFIVLNLACPLGDPPPSYNILDWADQLLKVDPSRYAIVVCHALFDLYNTSQFSTAGQAVYDALKDNPNLFLMLGGHVGGENRRQDIFNGNIVYSLLSDYQYSDNGGDGWMRLMEFQPANDQIRVSTYSPTLNQYDVDADSQFVLPYTFRESFHPLGSVSIVSGSTASLAWQNLEPLKPYEWYVTVSDGTTTTRGLVWSFTTAAPSTAPVIITLPVDQAANAGQAASFTSTASGVPTPTVQWQVSPNGTTWSNIPGAISMTYTFTAQASDDGKHYRAVFTNVAGSAVSNSAALTVYTAPVITAQPANQAVDAGQPASFSAAASGKPTPAVQWQASTDGGAFWSEISGAASTTLTFIAEAGDHGHQYRAVFSNPAGSAHSDPAVLTVYTAPLITGQPAGLSVSAAQPATFTAYASGNPAPAIRWQVSANQGGSWSDIPGATGNELSFIAQAADKGKQYRAVFTNRVGTAVSHPASLSVSQLFILYLPKIQFSAKLPGSQPGNNPINWHFR